jgi:hypothetical protein
VTNSLLVSLIFFSLLVVALNLRAMILYTRMRRQLLVCHHTVVLLGESGDGDPVLLAQFQVDTVGLDDTPELLWKNQTPIPVLVTDVHASWDWPALGMTGSRVQHLGLVFDPGDGCALQPVIRPRHVEEEE